MKAVVAAFNQEKALVGAFSVITNLRMELFGALDQTHLVIPSSRSRRAAAMVVACTVPGVSRPGLYIGERGRGTAGGDTLLTPFSIQMGEQCNEVSVNSGISRIRCKMLSGSK